MKDEPRVSIQEGLNWELRVPILRNGLIMRQLGLAIGIPFGILMLVLLLVKAYYGMLLVCAAMVLAFLLVLLIFRGTYDVRFVLNDKGILCENQEKQRRRVKKMSAAAFWLGVISRNPGAAGAGLLAGSRVETRIFWKKIKFDERRKTVTVSAGLGEKIAVFCTNENYAEVKEYIKSHRK
jgi:hypothetical protein